MEATNAQGNAPVGVVGQVLAAVLELRRTGGLIVVEGGPGSGTTYTLAAVERHCHRAGLGRPVMFADRTPAPTDLVDDAVVVVASTSGMAWPDDLATAGADLLEASRLRVVRLSPLPTEEIASIVRAVDSDPADAEVAQLVAAAGGNPLVATHLARHAHLDEPALDAVVVARLLSRFGPDARAVASVVSALQAVALSDLGLVAQLCDLPPSAVSRVFDTLSAGGLITPGEGGDQHALSIPWLAGALYDALGPATRDRIHRSAADALSTRSAPRPDLVAHHLLRTSATADEQEVGRLLTVADQLTSSAPDISVQCYRRALAHTDGPPERTAELTARLARAYLLAGRPEEAVDVGRTLLAGSGTRSSPAYPWLLPVVTEAMKATSAVHEAESILRSNSPDGIDELLGAQAAYLFAASGRDEEAAERVRRARGALAKHSVRGQVNVLSNLLHTQCISANFAELRHDAGLLTDIVDQAPDESRLHAWATLAHVWSVEGDLAASADAADRAEALLTGETWGIYVPEVRYARAAVSFANGDWASALRIATEADVPLARSGTVSYLQLMRHVRARILANRGDFTEARKAGGDPVSSPHFISALRTLSLAEVEMLEGSLEAAGQRLGLALAEDGLPGEVRAALLSLCASVAVLRQDDPLGRACVSEVEQRWGLAQASRQVRLEMQLALAMVNRSPAPAREALKEAGEHGFKLFEGRALLTLGTLGDDAERHLTEAMTVFGELDAVPWRRLTGTELRERGFKVPRRSRTSAASLTETEVQLARLVQAAKSNREIADAMSLSVKTVEVYLSRLYVKAGCKNRLDLARAADEGRLPLA